MIIIIYLKFEVNTQRNKELDLTEKKWMQTLTPAGE
jgi:hypothetical protein